MKTAVYSDFVAHRPVHNALAYEFANIIGDVASADVIAPPARLDHDIAKKLIKRLLVEASRRLQTARPPRVVRTSLEATYDVFVFIGSQVYTLSELNALRGWRERTGVKIAYIAEAWAAQLHSQAAYLKILNDFDHVFVLHRAAVPYLESRLRGRCTFLPTAVDALAADPFPNPPARTITFYSIGRRLEPVHRALVEMAQADNLHYLYDSDSKGAVYDWSQHRALTFNNIKRSEFFVSFDHVRTGGAKLQLGLGEHALPARLFEGAAGGSVLIGSAPRCPEFKEIFPWPDAVIELPDSDDVRDFVRDLRSQHERLAAVRRTNVVECLRAHDWAHRWKTMLETAGLDGSPLLRARLRDLAVRADLAAHNPLEVEQERR